MSRIARSRAHVVSEQAACSLRSQVAEDRWRSEESADVEFTHAVTVTAGLRMDVQGGVHEWFPVRCRAVR